MTLAKVIIGVISACLALFYQVKDRYDRAAYHMVIAMALLISADKP